jgi:FkbM family methyltransferase
MISKTLVKSAFRSFGLDVTRLSSLSTNRNQPADDPFLHQQRLLAHGPVEVVFDLGARVGKTVARYRKLFPSAHIFCFEPFDDSYAVLTRTHQDASRVKPQKLAVSDTCGTQAFHCSDQSDMNSLLPLSSNAGLLTTASANRVITVETVTLDTFCAQHRLDRIQILKMDIQGAELKALRGAAGLLERQAIDLVYTEMNFGHLYEGQGTFHDVSRLLGIYSYNLYGLYNIAYSRNGPIGWADAIFISPQLLAQIARPA